MVACFTKFIVDQSLDHRQLLVSLVELRPLIGSDLHRHRCEVLKPKTNGQPEECCVISEERRIPREHLVDEKLRLRVRHLSFAVIAKGIVHEHRGCPWKSGYLSRLEIWILVVLAFVGQVIDKASADSSETSVRLFFLCISSMVGDVLSPKMSHPWSKQALKQNNSLYDQQLLAATSCSNFLQQLFMISFFAVQILGFIS